MKTRNHDLQYLQMKPYFLFVLMLFLSLSAHAQIDSRNNSVAIPAIEAETDSIDSSPLTPSKPIENNPFKLNTPKVAPNLEMPKKQFSMFPEEEFGNPGELYTQQLDDHLNSIKSQLELGTKGSKTDQYFGVVETESDYAIVQYRDFGEEDGDLIRVSLNGEIVEYRITLRNHFKGLKLKLQKGKNTIEFLAINEGYLLPNTAHFRVRDDMGAVIASNQWNLSKGVKAYITVVKK
ncbi:hypothetical protein [Tamlana crocina]|uniref:Secreted protein n=1 Tax=Tamlana crocina TaxID=393006 RepID=A0ABX1D9P3_9FLAO|nr:hypothetical protein [Tamlana crocina]NJX15090.1 hypothetical protein [Tamlana crocina]